ncbi:hypothetical protein ACE6H2_015802 [Prunus campanulata]
MITYDEEVHMRNMISDEMVWARDGWVLPGYGGSTLGMKIEVDDCDLIYRGWVALERSLFEFIP